MTSSSDNYLPPRAVKRMMASKWSSQSMAHVACWQNLRVKAREMIRITAFAALTLLQFAIAYNSQASASEAAFSDFPFMVHCELNGIDRAYYLSKIDPDGVATYISPDRQAGTITVSGEAKPVGGDWAGSCSGKTLEELRAAGQAYDLQR